MLNLGLRLITSSTSMDNNTQATSFGEGSFNVHTPDHHILGQTVSRLLSPAPCLRFMETTLATGSGQDLPSIFHVPRNHRSCSWKVKRRLKLARRHSGQAPSNMHFPRNNLNHGRKVKRRLKLAYRHHRIHGNYASSEARGQNMISTPPLMQFMKYVPPLVLVLVTLKYQGKPQIIFWENPVPLWCFVAATCVYWLIVGAMKQMTTLGHNWFQILSHAALALAVFSTTSLVSIFLPYPVSLLPVAVLISFSVALVLLRACSLFLRGIECVINKIHGILVRARGSNLTEVASLPV